MAPLGGSLPFSAASTRPWRLRSSRPRRLGISCAGQGGYFAGMVRKAEKGELHLERTLWALRQAKWGKHQSAAKERLMN
jgi:hypothetical protein